MIDSLSQAWALASSDRADKLLVVLSQIEEYRVGNNADCTIIYGRCDDDTMMLVKYSAALCIR
jgi:hypothetical protein